MKDILNTYIKDTIKILERAESKLLENKIQSITIDEKYFDNKFMFDVNISEYFEEFKKLKANKVAKACRCRFKRRTL